jgi:FAD/FMN-containing dehydrogenase
LLDRLSKMLDGRIVSGLRAIAGNDAVIARPTELKVYECDGYTLEKSVPEVVVLPASTEQVVQILRLLHRENIAFVPRGAGTGLSGGCLPVGAPVMIGTSRMNRIIEINEDNMYAVVEPYVIHAQLQAELMKRGLTCNVNGAGGITSAMPLRPILAPRGGKGRPSCSRVTVPVTASAPPYTSAHRGT